MNKVLQRLLVFFVGIPVVVGIVLLDFCHHLPLHIVITVSAVTASAELYSLLSANGSLAPKPLVLTLSGIVPVSAYGFVLCGINVEYVNWVLLGAALILIGAEVFSRKTFEESNTRTALSLFILFYGSFLLTFLSRMTTVEYSDRFLAVFLVMVFICDSSAWLFGMLFGRNNRGVCAASPNKSVAGFAGGYAGAVAVAVAAGFLWPDVFRGGIWRTVVLGLLVATAAIIGDLAESVLKRSANRKDSGIIIPGRGGLLDSIDSIVFSAPVYYAAIRIMYLI